MNQLHALILTAPEPIRSQLRDLTRADRLAVCAGYRPGDRDDLLAITKLALRELATRINDLTVQIRRIESRRARLVKATAPRLMKIYGVGPDTAAALLSAAGDNPERLKNESSYAALLGASPIKASSGKTKRVRLNHGGDRLGNSALWHIVMTRMSKQPATQAYVDRRIHEGLTKTEIIRCLKRYVAREIFNALPRELLT